MYKTLKLDSFKNTVWGFVAVYQSLNLFGARTEFSCKCKFNRSISRVSIKCLKAAHSTIIARYFVHLKSEAHNDALNHQAYRFLCHFLFTIRGFTHTAGTWTESMDTNAQHAKKTEEWHKIVFWSRYGSRASANASLPTWHGVKRHWYFNSDVSLPLSQFHIGRRNVQFNRLSFLFKNLTSLISLVCVFQI